MLSTLIKFIANGLFPQQNCHWQQESQKGEGESLTSQQRYCKSEGKVILWGYGILLI